MNEKTKKDLIEWLGSLATLHNGTFKCLNPQCELQCVVQDIGDEAREWLKDLREKHEVQD